MALLAGLACGCATPAVGSAPTEAEARELLARIVVAAQARDFRGLCAFGDANCEDVLDSAGRDRVPPLPPTVAGSWSLPRTATSPGGIVLQLCGVDAAGQRYVTEMLVQAGADGPIAIQPVYWSGMRVPRDATVGDDGSLALDRCPRS